MAGAGDAGPAASRPVRAWRAAREVVVGVAQEAHRDNLPFLASAITFNILLAAAPFLLIVVSVLSLTLLKAAEANGVNPIAHLQHSLGILVPVLPERGIAPEVIQGLIEQGRTLGLIGFGLFLWFSTRLFGSLRTVLRQIFQLPQERGLVWGKLFDVQMVLVSSVLFLVNVGITVVLNLARGLGVERLGLSGRSVGIVETGYAFVTAWLFIFVMFLLLFRYVPARRLPWRAAALAAGVTAVGWEVLKAAFSVYLTRFANFESVYGNLATVIVVVVWLYYISIVFLLGAETAFVYERRRARPPGEGVGL